MSNLKRMFATEQQKMRLLEMLQNNENLLKGKFTSNFTFKQAQEEWSLIAEELNSMPGAKKNWVQWKKTWCDLKKNAKKKNTEINRYTSGTGGRPPPQDISLVDEAILDLVGGTSLEGDPDVAESSASVSFIPESDEHNENKTSQEAGSAQKAIKQKKIDNALSASTNLIDQNKELIQIKKEYYQEKLRIKMEHLKIEKEKMLIERERLELEKENLKCRQQELDERKEDNLIKRRIAEILEELI